MNHPGRASVSKSGIARTSKDSFQNSRTLCKRRIFCLLENILLELLPGRAVAPFKTKKSVEAGELLVELDFFLFEPLFFCSLLS